MSEPSLAGKIVALHAAFAAAQIPHAFGGALALAYYAEPRVTVDIDINVFVSPERSADVIHAIAPLGVSGGPSIEVVMRDAQGRWRWGRNPVDLFFSDIAFHDAMQERVRTVSFGNDEIPILGPEHLLVAKAVFNRTKDWIDIEQVLLGTRGLDTGEIDRWLDEIVGAKDHRAVRFRETRHRLLG